MPLGGKARGPPRWAGMGCAGLSVAASGINAPTALLTAPPCPLPPCPPPSQANLRTLNALAKVLRRRRAERGALSLASPEVKFEIDTETHDPLDVGMYQVGGGGAGGAGGGVVQWGWGVGVCRWVWVMVDASCV